MKASDSHFKNSIQQQDGGGPGERQNWRQEDQLADRSDRSRKRNDGSLRRGWDGATSHRMWWFKGHRI